MSQLGSRRARLDDPCPCSQLEGQLCHSPHVHLCLSRLHQASCPSHSSVAIGTLWHLSKAAAFAKGVVSGTAFIFMMGKKKGPRPQRQGFWLKQAREKEMSASQYNCPGTFARLTHNAHFLHPGLDYDFLQSWELEVSPVYLF